MENKKIMGVNLHDLALSNFGRDFSLLTDKEKYIVLSKKIMSMILPSWEESKNYFKDKKNAYYFSAEFLMGRALGNNLINLKIEDEIKEELEKLNINLTDIEEAENDEALGNGGLGRLAACFLDSAATLDYPLHGYGIRYEYGLFKQKIVDGAQVEFADDWDCFTDPWAIKRADEKVLINFSDQQIYAVPYDTPIIGYSGKTINTLRLWSAEPVNKFDFQLFNDGRFEEATKEDNKAQIISRVLYPNDSTNEGKALRLKQQYFFVSASLQDLIKKHKEKHNDFKNFGKLHAIQLNDTHPTVAIPELIRLLVNFEGLSFEEAFNICVETFAYTNHTILAEALEKWNIDLFRTLLPEVFYYVEKIQDRFISEMKNRGLNEVEINNISILNHGVINMAYMAIYGSHSTNGVAKLHTEILKDVELNSWYKIYPERFNNKTNGITQRRWLLKSNPELASFITKKLNSTSWITNLDELNKLMEFVEDEKTLLEFIEIKKLKKRQLKEYIKFHEGIDIYEDSIFDVQVKRLHEYKRQLMNALHILDLYFRIKDKKVSNIQKRTFIFGAKAAPGYFRAKGIIKLINEIKNLIEKDNEVKDYIKVVFCENYRVSYGEKIFPACDISEQISTTGKEASGTGNMKFMLNGAPTIGTLDGANVEIVEEAGEENNFIFGLKLDEVEELRNNYNPLDYYNKDEYLKKSLDALVDGTLNDGGTGAFKDIYNSLLHGNGWEKADNYLILKDFESYREAQDKVNDAFKDEKSFYKMAFINMAKAGKFSSDRTIHEYAKEIWNIDKE